MVTTGFREYFAGKAFPRDTCEKFCFAILSYLIHHVSTHTIYTHITHILRGVLFREKTLAITFERQRLSYPQSSTQFIMVFLILLPLHIHIHIHILKVDSPNTNHTQFECQVSFWCCWEALEEAKLWLMQLGALWDPES